ncbi:MAG: hypothetical protein PVH30_04995 [Desulfobacterales bacterium]|jgi:hypothetical protein
MMREQPVIKKILVNMGADGEPDDQSELLIPCLWGSNGDIFIGIDSHETYRYGFMAYLGFGIEPNEVLSRLDKTPGNPDRAIDILMHYFQQIQQFRVGSVLSIDFEDDGVFFLKMVADRVPNPSVLP